MRLLTAIFLFSIALVPAIAETLDDEVFPPEPIPPDRYAVMMKRSPFVLPTVEEQKVEVTASWVNDYQIVSILKIGGESVVLAKKVSTNERIPIRAKQNAQGIRLLSLQMSPDPRNVSATVELDGAEGTIQYDPSILSGMPNPVATDNPALKSE